MLVLANVLQPLIDVNEAILKFFHDNIGLGWGGSIIGLTCVVRLAILPLTFKQVRSMQALQRLQPEMKKIQERFKEDKQRMQQELMKFYQEHNFNPLSSCFPLLLQFPFFMSLFYLQRTDKFKHEVQSTDPSFLNIPDITKPVHGTTLVVMLLIYLTTQMASSYVSSVNVQDPTQRRLLFIFPIFFSFIIIRFPAGLIIYWITTNVWTIGQQLVIRKFLPTPEPLPATSGGGGGGGSGGKGKAAPAGAAAASGGGARKGFFARAMAAAEGAQTKRGDAAKGEAAAGGRGRDGAGVKPEKRPAAKQSDGKRAEAKPKGPKADRSADGANGGPSKPPPASPRKKKKRSGRRR